MDGGATYRGRLEICINFVWGTVCDDSFDTSDARVACRQLGYEVDGEKSKQVFSTALCINSLIVVRYYSNAYFGQGRGPTWLNYLYCSGFENSLLDCNRAYAIGNPNGCSHSEDVGIECPGNIGNVNCSEIIMI